MTDLSGKRALFILTSVSQFPESDRLTGFYMDEMAIPYWALRDAGVEIDFASIKGGEAPADPSSIGEEGDRKPSVQRFLDDGDAMADLQTSKAIGDVEIDQYDGLFLPGGHGTMWDFAQSDELANFVGHMFDKGGIVGAVCHGPAGLLSATTSGGVPIVADRKINAFTDAEEREVGLADVVPYLLETELRAKGAKFEATSDKFSAYAVRDGNIVTGQNPASAEPVARLLVEAFADTQLTNAA
ncbi:type 1 glutamine amidotransferase domain-containing protein [Litoreibacter roseus]|uniref:Dimethylallyltransferase n=1 Tax=Litoreibacter roseus TaxID=2601869 RepID=A0A6N6JK37_9RHOB|nr:type 1 glutamine amidotransferase domain-containing protein [Litoreibacter roseus]GFE65648.1 dimethylallyltransferase [Litoreibacter roseus]